MKPHLSPRLADLQAMLRGAHHEHLRPLAAKFFVGDFRLPLFHVSTSDRKTAAFGGGLANAAVYFYSTGMARTTGRWRRYRSGIGSRSGKDRSSRSGCSSFVLVRILPTYLHQ